ncbi:MAG TPA: hypothetical protein PLX70_04785, partial [Solirubrobacterales bacterium]|nr:hypothetical protein [Solirubrobacterales bacterium]
MAEATHVGDGDVSAGRVGGDRAAEVVSEPEGGETGREADPGLGPGDPVRLQVGDRVGTAPVVLLDSGGLTYLLYSDTSGNQRTFLRRSATGWAADRCGQFCGAAPEVVFDAQDNLHYLDGNTHTIWTGTNAARRTIEPQESVAEGAIAIDPRGGVHFAYRTTQAS